MNIPDDLEATLRSEWGERLDRAVLEAFAMEGYRAGKFGSATVKSLLGHASRWDTERWLAERNIPLNYTLEDLEADREVLARLLPVKK